MTLRYVVMNDEKAVVDRITNKLWESGAKYRVKMAANGNLTLIALCNEPQWAKIENLVYSNGRPKPFTADDYNTMCETWPNESFEDLGKKIFAAEVGFKKYVDDDAITHEYENLITKFIDN